MSCDSQRASITILKALILSSITVICSLTTYLLTLFLVRASQLGNSCRKFFYAVCDLVDNAVAVVKITGREIHLIDIIAINRARHMQGQAYANKNSSMKNL